MDKYTLLIINNLDYNQILTDLLKPNEADRVFPAQMSKKVILILALITGLPLRSLICLNWNNILQYDGKGGATIKSQLEVDRKYDFHISLKVHKQIIQFYNYLGQPSFNTPIAEQLRGYSKLENWYAGTNVTLGLGKFENLEADIISKYKNEHLTQILFGRRVLETCGYSSKLCKFLMGLFKIESKDILLDFLGFKSKKDIAYSLNDISMNEGKKDRYQFGSSRSFLNDNKHFFNIIDNSDKYYPFQHFQLFYDFLKVVNLSSHDVKTRGVLSLLMISLTNGIRPSSLLKLKWSDVFEIGKKNGILDCYLLKKSFKFGRHIIKIDNHTMKLLIVQFSILHAGRGVKVDTDNRQLTFLDGAPPLENECFITNRKNTLTQPSLLREIRKALQKAEFQHAEKFTTKSTMIMYGRRIIEMKGNHPQTIKALKKHFNFRRTQDLFDFLYINNKKGSNIPDIGEFSSVFDHILYDI